MKTYTVHEPPQQPADRLDRAGSLVFVRDGFSWSAFLLTILWALANRLWLVLAGYVATVLAIYFGLDLLDLEKTAAMPIAFASLQLAIGFEAASLKRAELRFWGWEFLGSVNGASREDCERRFFELWLPMQPLIRVESLSNSSFLDGTAFAATRDRLRSRIGGFGRDRSVSR